MSSPAPARVPPSLASATLAVAGVQMVSGIDPAANCEAAAVAIA